MRLYIRPHNGNFFAMWSMCNSPKWELLEVIDNVLTMNFLKRKNKQTLFRGAIFSVVAIFLFLACSSEKPSYIKSSGPMLGTFMQVNALATVEPSELYTMMMEIDQEAKASMSLFDEKSLLSRVNRNQTDLVDHHITHCLELSRRFSKMSDGSYDVTIAPLVEAYGFAGKDRGAQVNVDSLLEFIGISKVEIKDGRLLKADPRVKIDFNSIAKGYVVDMAAERLEKMGVESYLVDIGGEVRCKGTNDKGGAWRIGIETPFDGNNTPGAFIQQVISLSGCSMATSGNYRRYYIDEQGNKVAHTIDPKTGRSVVSDLLSATVIAPTCAEADAYGTMFMAMGKERSIALAKELAREGVMVYFITAGEGDKFEVYYSAKLAPMLKTTEGFHALR